VITDVIFKTEMQAGDIENREIKYLSHLEFLISSLNIQQYTCVGRLILEFTK